jgi:threonine dehydrogenase-like Zn-dependent dehydrogenase
MFYFIDGAIKEYWMKSAILHGARDFRIEEQESPEYASDECLIDVKVCGVCHSELHQWENKIEGLDYPRRIGHEVAGVVREVGTEVSNIKKNDRVAVWVDEKGYSEQIVVKQDRIFSLSDSIPFKEAMAEPIACTTNGVNCARISLGDTVILVGTGFMGLILLQQVRLRGPEQIIAVDIRDEMLTSAKELGADMVLNPKKENINDIIKTLTDGRGADICFEVGGTQNSLNLAASLCRMEGKLVIFGYHPGSRTIEDLGYWNWMAFDIINAHFRDLRKILDGSRRGMKLLNKGDITLRPLITHTYPLEDINTAFATAIEKPEGFIKAVIVFE